MNIQYKDPYSMSDKDRNKALKLLSGKRIQIHALDTLEGAETSARLVMKMAQKFGAVSANTSGDETDQDVFVSIRKGTSLPFQFWVGEGPRTHENTSEPRVSLVEESTHEELTARILMAMCYFLEKKQQGAPLPDLSRATLSAATKGDGNCFVCTVCMGSADHPRVTELREFRDQILVQSSVGRKFISAYYSVGPRIADWLAGRKTARSIVRLTIVLPFAAVARQLIKRSTGSANTMRE